MWGWGEAAEAEAREERAVCGAWLPRCWLEEERPLPDCRQGPSYSFVELPLLLPELLRVPIVLVLLLTTHNFTYYIN